MRSISTLLIRIFPLALWLSVNSVTRGESALNAVRLHPLAQAPSFSFAAGAPGNTNAADQVTDPRVVELAQWLQQHVAATQDGNLANAGGGQRVTAQKQALVRLQLNAGGNVQVRLRKENGTPLQIKGTVLERSFAGIAKAFNDRDELTARSFLRLNRALLRIDDPDNELAFNQKQTDNQGRRHLRFAQIYRGLPVWPCELSVHTDAAGNIELMDGAFIPTPAEVAMEAVVTAAEAVAHAQQEAPNGSIGRASAPELVIYGPLNGAPRLAWKFNLVTGLTRGWQFVIDALTGATLLTVDLVHTAAETGSGIDDAGQNRVLNLWREGTTYYMIDASKPMFNATSTPPDPNKTLGAIIIRDAQNTPPTSSPDRLDQIVQVTSTSANSGWVPDAVGAAFALSETYDYYRERFGRNSLDGQGGSIVATVRLGLKFPNAFWSAEHKAMFFGDGYPKALDVAGHEMTHGVLNSIGNGGILEYHDQSGALNESLADIFGEMVETRNAGRPSWLMGEKTVNGGVRNFADPGAFEYAPGKKNPAKMSEFLYVPNTHESDNGGVHFNSGIINHAYYLLAAGLDGAIGLSDAEKIFYRAMTLHLQKQSQFIDMRHACIASAEELFNRDSTQTQKTAAAFDAVEIFDAPVTSTPSPIPTVQGADSTLFLRFEPLFGVVYLVRRETARNDPSSGTLLNTVDFLTPRRVSVSGDGSFAVFVTANNDLGFVNTDGSSAVLLNQPGLVYSVAMALDGKHFAFVTLDATGQPTNKITFMDLATQTAQTVTLYAPGTEGAKLDIIKYADVMSFLPDGQTLVYDAYSETKTKDGAIFGGWTMYTLNRSTQTIGMLIDLNEGLDFGNPSLGHARNYLVTYEIIDKQTGRSSLFAGNLQTGATSRIGTMDANDALGAPGYTGDDSAIVYAQVDNTTATGYSLVRQALAADGITPAGNPTLWAGDAAYGVVYRRGTYVSTNALPDVKLVSPTPGQSFAPATSISIQATVTDSDGTIAKVEFYAGSTKLGEDTAAPYIFAWPNVAAGRYRLSARAIDNLGASGDSTAVEIVVGAASAGPAITTQPLSQTVTAGSAATFSVAATGTGTLSYQWRKNDNNLAGQTGTALTLPSVTLADAGTYTVVVSDAAGSVTSSPAVLTVNSGDAGDLVRITSIQRGADRAIDATFTSGPNKSYTVQASIDLKNWTPIATVLAAASTSSFRDADAKNFAQRFYRVSNAITTPTNATTISPQAVLPASGQIYAAGTIFGSPLLGFQFTIPPNWKGGNKLNTSLFLFGSDTEPGLFVTMLGLAGDAAKVQQAFNGSFSTSQTGGFQLSQPPALSGNRIVAEWSGVGDQAPALMRVEALLHPSGGVLVFAGLFLEQNRAVMQRTLDRFTSSSVVAPRPIDEQWTQLIAGKMFQWGSFSSAGNGGSSGSLQRWSQNNAFFCQGTYEITKQSESSYSGNLSGGGFYTGGGSSSSTEAGDWTVLKTDQGPLMLMLSANGVQAAIVRIGSSGNSIIFADQEFSFVRPHSCP